ncbi:unnamed protein product [Parascedosporium putredinis]|uniref:Uncharacterized protein n=1 Tax=Parascedosporium putredinis TaxID=1442378 RepID=A0A9P1H1E7_9PEZI|nr:unnamed protein product [Parascedosporium putredinis]CAI7995088.1 unnamed protein product [Parascedosporium putredinis]
MSVLIDGLAASLSTTGRESVLPLSPSPRDTARGEIADQARRIANLIVKYVRESVNPARLSAALSREPLRIRSPCEGHLWTPAAAALLLGPRSDAKLMELYNEWLHRMILLRDSLLPFENFEEVPLVVLEGSTRGLREVEEPRKLFLVHCLTGAIQHAAIVDLAKGLVLPAFLSGSKSLHLLRYHPARFYQGEEEVLFDYEHNEYVDAPRTELTPAESSPSPPLGRWDFASLLAAADPRVSESELAIDEVGDSLRRVVRLRLTLESGICVSVDLGQIARGRRYAYEIRPNLSLDDSLSTLYPENVILLRENDNVQALQKVGKGFADRCFITHFSVTENHTLGISQL